MLGLFRRTDSLRVRSPKNGTTVERKIFVWHATIINGSVIAMGLEK